MHSAHLPGAHVYGVQATARRVFALVRLAVAGIVVAALLSQLFFTWSIYAGVPRYLIKYASFFTVQSNAFAVGVLLLAAWYGWRAQEDPPRLGLLRCSATVYMIVTSAVYHMPFNVITLDQPISVTWANEVLHFAAPVYLLLDWLLAPGRQRVAWGRYWVIMSFPVAWIVYTMVRAPLVGWYPYPFLNPRFTAHGNLLVAGYIAAIAAFISMVDLAMLASSRLPVLWGPRRARAARSRPIRR
jgi:hypothetical protein